MLSERRRCVLAALIQEYVRSAQPVASGQLAARSDLRVSAATIRNELAFLEGSGLVRQPHVSAGRVPTDSGYRAFVDGLLETGGAEGLTADEVEGVHERYGVLEHEVTEAMRATSALLSRLTSYLAVAVAPAQPRAHVRRVSLVWIGEARAVVVVVNDAGIVADRICDLREIVTADQLAAVESVLNAAVADAGSVELLSPRAMVEIAAHVPARVGAELLEAVLECAQENEPERVVTGGVSGLLAQPEFADPHLVGGLLQLLEDGLATLQVLAGQMQGGDVVVRIGSENPAGLDRLSVVTASYDAGGAAGVVGVIGPTRMDYPRAVAAVRTVADGLSEALG